MNDEINVIPDMTLEAFARGFFNEASLYGFKRTDYIRFVNHLLDITIMMTKSQDNHRSSGDLLFCQYAKLQFQSGLYDKELPITGKNITIRALDFENDLDHMRHWLTDKYGRHFALSYTDPIMPKVEDLLSNAKNHFGVVTLKSGIPIGTMAFLNHDQTNCKAELRKLIGDPAMRGHGFGKEAALLWLSYGVSMLGLKKIVLSTLDTNTRNIRLNESLGFKVEGILRNEVLLDGRYRDVLRMGLWID